MIIKTFTAESVAGALKSVRKELGGDAVVLKTRQTVDDSGVSRIEVTACLDKPSAAQASTALADAPTQRAEQSSDPESTEHVAVPASESRIDAATIVSAASNASTPEDLVRIEKKLDLILSGRLATIDHAPAIADVMGALERADVPADTISEIRERIAADTTEDPVDIARSILTDSLKKIVTQPIEVKAGERIVFVGPSGSGKTSLMGRVAASLVLDHSMKTRLVSLDDVKVGAADEIQSYADLLDTRVAHSPDESKTADDVVLIDTPALPTDDKSRSSLIDRINAFEPTYRVLTVSALYHSTDLIKLIRRATVFGATHLAITMLDLTDRWGTILTAAEAAGLQLAYITDAPSGRGPAHTPTADEICNRIMPQEAIHEEA